MGKTYKDQPGNKPIPAFKPAKARDWKEFDSQFDTFVYTRKEQSWVEKKIKKEAKDDEK